MRAHADRDDRRGIWRRLALVGPTGEFLTRRGLDLRIFGLYVHRIRQADPGLDLHDHPWSFVSIVLRGGYVEERAEIRRAPQYAEWSDRTLDGRRGWLATWRAGSVHRVRLDEAHRIVEVEPGTVTLVLRGRKLRAWGFYLETGWVDQRAYDYEARRPLREER